MTRFIYARPNRPLLVSAGVGLYDAGTTQGGNAGTGITVDELPTVDRIYQRIGTSRTFTVSGTYAGTPSLIQARVVDAITGQGKMVWTTLATNPTGGTYSGTLTVPQGGMYKLQVRDGVNTTITATTTNKFGVGIIVAMLGQSNMAHMTDTEDLYPLVDLNTRRYATGAWRMIGNYDSTGTYPPGTFYSTYGGSYTAATPRGDGIITFVNTLRAGLGIPVGTLEYAVSGSSISDWQPTTGPYWNTFVGALDASGGECEAAIWYQGEENAGASTTSAAYQASLLNILNALRTHVGRDASTFNFGVVTLGPTTGYATEGRFGVIRSAQLDFIAANAGTYLAGVPTDGTLLDIVHLNPASLRTMGKRYANSLIARLGGVEKPGPKITGATRSGATITVSITASGALSSGGTLQGFRVYDNGTPVTISGTSISGSNVILTLASTPTGTVTMDYAMANSPYSSTAGVLYDADSLPLQPHALMTVA